MTRKERCDPERTEHSPSRRIGRRDYLKTTAATAAAVSGVSGVAGADSYETITASGQTITIGAGETWSNKLVDFGNKNSITIIAKDTDWTVRDVGFEGTMPPDTIFGVADTGGGTSRMENVYVGEGDVNQDPNDRGIAVWVDPDHSGHLDVVNVNFHVPGNNGIYGSAPGSNSGGNRGDIVIDGCYAKDNHHTAYRVSDNYDEIRNSVSYVSGDRTCNRNTWIWDSPDGGTATLENLDLITSGESSSVVENDDPTIDMTDVCTDDGRGTGCTPTNYVPDGCPTSAEEAASGESSGGGGGGGGSVDVAPAVVDDFERSSPLDEYGGATNLYSVESSTVYEGSQAITNDGGDFGSAVSTSGLSDYPDRGDEVHFHFTNASDDNFVACHFFAQSETDNPDCYSAGIGGSGGWRLWRHEGGSVTEIANANLSASDQIDGWYRAEVWSDDSTIYADLYDDANDSLLASVQADDTAYSSGGIGFRSAGNGEVWDYAVRNVIDDFERSSPLDEYGGATSLFGTTSSAYEGSQALVNDGGDYGSVVSTAGLDGYPERGEDVTVYFSNASDDNFVACHFLAQSEQDNPDSYSAGIGNSGDWRLWRHEGGSVTEIAQASLPAADQIDGWYRAELSSDASTVYADLYDDANDALLASVQADDTTYSSGGIGFRSVGNGEVWDFVTR